MKIRIALLILLMSIAALACGLLVACGNSHEHNYEMVKLGKQASCTENGWATYSCTVCGEKKDDIIPARHPFYDWHVWVYADCENDGYRDHNCAICGFKEQEKLPALGHCFDEWRTLVNPGCANTGLEVRDCSVCGKRDEHALTATSHEYVDGRCKSCGRRNWDIVDIYDINLYNSEYGFRTLACEESGASLQTLYLLIDEDTRKYHGGTSQSTILGSYDYGVLGLTFDEAISVYKVYMDDHPLYYWLSRMVYYGDTLNVSVDEAYTDPEVRAEFNKTIYETAGEWRRDTEENAYLAALSYHDKIIYAVDYAYLPDGRTPQTASWAHNIIGVFTQQGAVCEGYARTFQLMLNMTGIENVFVTGTSQGVAHAWNLAKLDDGEWYWFDLTYDDVPGWLWGVKYSYFAVTDMQDVNWVDGDRVTDKVYFNQNHTPDNGVALQYLPPLPERSASIYSGAGELRLKQTFKINEFEYAVAGYRAVQLISCSASGDVDIPSYVEYDGISYEVISVGAMKDSLFTSSYNLSVFNFGAINRLYFPETIRFIWDNGRPMGNKTGFGLGEHIFSSVEEYAVAEDNEYYASVDGVLFTKSLYTLIGYPGNSPRTEYCIPDETVWVADKAFYEVNNLRSLTLGANLVNIGIINLGYNWPSDEYNGSYFVNHNGLTNVMTTYGGCKVLEEIKVSPENIYFSAENGLLYNKDKTYLYAGVTLLTEAVISANVEKVQDSAFSDCKQLQRVTFVGDALKSLGENVFSGCSSLKEIVFGGTREQWNAVKKDTETYYYNITCLGDL